MRKILSNSREFLALKYVKLSSNSAKALRHELKSYFYHRNLYKILNFKIIILKSKK
ncbi:hypothetical protein [Mycoplasmopsis californica]|uniref:hypothetical protein n=1 Tax=Mycoplasmopsis californica TaxID=2113 RepID=UPI000AC8E781|nr:hypothetical protein [Mycoplasmopsis californica]